MAEAADHGPHGTVDVDVVVDSRGRWSSSSSWSSADVVDVVDVVDTCVVVVAGAAVVGGVDGVVVVVGVAVVSGVGVPAWSASSASVGGRRWSPSSRWLVGTVVVGCSGRRWRRSGDELAAKNCRR